MGLVRASDDSCNNADDRGGVRMADLQHQEPNPEIRHSG